VSVLEALPGGRKLVLIVDASPDVQEAAQRSLGVVFETIVVDDAFKAWEIARKSRPHLLVHDGRVHQLCKSLDGPVERNRVKSLERKLEGLQEPA
jgi:hypothetical protein